MLKFTAHKKAQRVFRMEITFSALKTLKPTTTLASL
jgi:hypothetical protein